MDAERYGVSVLNDVTQNRMVVQVGLEQKHHADMVARHHPSERDPQLESFRVDFSPEAQQAMDEQRKLRSSEEMEAEARVRGQEGRGQGGGPDGEATPEIMGARAMGRGEPGAGQPEAAAGGGGQPPEDGTGIDGSSQGPAEIMGARTMGLGENGAGAPDQVHVPGSFADNSAVTGPVSGTPQQAAPPSPMPVAAQQGYTSPVGGGAATVLDQVV